MKYCQSCGSCSSHVVDVGADVVNSALQQPCKLVTSADKLYATSSCKQGIPAVHCASHVCVAVPSSCSQQGSRRKGGSCRAAPPAALRHVGRWVGGPLETSVQLSVTTPLHHNKSQLSTCPACADESLPPHSAKTMALSLSHACPIIPPAASQLPP